MLNEVKHTYERGPRNASSTKHKAWSMIVLAQFVAHYRTSNEEVYICHAMDKGLNFVIMLNKLVRVESTYFAWQIWLLLSFCRNQNDHQF